MIGNKPYLLDEVQKLRCSLVLNIAKCKVSAHNVSTAMACTISKRYRSRRFSQYASVSRCATASRRFNDLTIQPFNRSAFLAFCIAAMAIWASGCAHFNPRPLSAAVNADQLESRSLTNADLQAFVSENLHHPAPSITWDLDALTWAAFYYHPSLELARAQLLVAQGGEVTAGQRPNPVLTVSPQYDTTTLTPSPWVVTASLDVPLETAGKRGHRRARAANLAEAARLNISAIAYKIRSDVRAALVDLLAAEARNQLIQRQLSIQQDLVQRMEQQFRAGAISGAEALPMRLALERARLDAADAQRLAADARSRLAEALGLPLRALADVSLQFDLNDPLPNVQSLLASEIRREALLSRPDILGALADYRASESALRLELAKQYPDVHLQPGYEFDQGDNKWGLGFVVELPVLNQNQGPIAEARARRQESAAKFNALQATVLAEVDRAVAQFRASQTNSALLRSLAETANQRERSAEEQLRAGAIDQTEVLNARLEAVSARLIQLDGQQKLQQAVGALENAVQRPLDLPRSMFTQSAQNANHDPADAAR
jgi:outer membrane protein, heavy metal efflux system